MSRFPRRTMKSYVVVSFLVLSLCVASLTLAQSDQKREISVEVNYLGGNLETRFNSALKAESANRFGRTHNLDGFQFFGWIWLTDRLVIAGRVEENFLRQTRYFSSDPQEGFRSWPDSDLTGAHSRYQEVFGSVAFPKTTRHRLIVGAARTVFSQNWRFTTAMSPDPSLPGVGDGELPLLIVKINSKLSVSTIGPVVGVEGGRELRGLELNWSGRVYPRLARTDRRTITFEPKEAKKVGDRENQKRPFPSSSRGFEFRGTVSYWLASRMAITGGYQFRRLFQSSDPSDPNYNWALKETQTEKGFLGGIRFVF